MSTPVQGLPPDRVGADLSAGAASILIDDDLYPLEAVYGAAFVFLDRCYVLLDKPEPGKVRITLAGKQGEPTADTLREYVGELANELLASAWRHQIAADNRAVIEATTMQAIAGAMGPPSLDDLADFDFTEEPFDDPLGIAMSWEEKYARNKPTPESDE